MKTKNMKSVLVCLCLILVGTMSYAQHKTKTALLKIGDKAPPIKVEKWLKGGSISTFKKGHIYVVDFGFTTCTPCIAGIPHLADLANKYKGNASVISVFVHDPIFRVEKLMRKIGDRMEYTVAIDNNEGSMDSTWVKAAGLNGYPTVFVIDKRGQIAWIGSNVKLLDQHVNSLIEGTFNTSKSNELDKKQQDLFNRIFQNQNKGNHAVASKIIDSLITVQPKNIEYNIFKFKHLLKIDEDQAYQYGWKMLQNQDWELYETSLYKISLFAMDVPRYQRPDYNLAIAMNEKVIESCPIDLVVAHAYHTISCIYYLKGDAPKGREIMLKAIDSLSPEYHKLREQWLKEIDIYPKTILGRGKG